jgi:hypothetical protein
VRHVVRALLRCGILFGLGLSSVFETRACPNLEPITGPPLARPRASIEPTVCATAETRSLDAPGLGPVPAVAPGPSDGLQGWSTLSASKTTTVLHGTVLSVLHRGKFTVTLSFRLAMIRAGLKTPDRCVLYSTSPPTCSPGLGAGVIERSMREMVDGATFLLSLRHQTH